MARGPCAPINIGQSDDCLIPQQSDQRRSEAGKKAPPKTSGAKETFAMSDLSSSGSRRNTSHDLARNDAAIVSGPIVTAIPAGLKWRLKALGPDGTVELPDVFHNRLEALGACVLLSEQCGGRVIP